MDQPTLAPLVTFLISTFNRRDVLLRTLAELQEIGRRSGLMTQTVVVDNRSEDETADAVASQFPTVRIVRLNRNLGACGKNAGLDVAGGEFVLFLDDDSHPTVGSVRRMVDHFLVDPHLGAAVFDVTLPDGSHECSAYPAIAIGCGTGFRMAALRQVGGLPGDFFMQAEEYDLSLRLLDAKWAVRRFDDLHVRHLKTPAARVPTRTTRLDVRNNLLVIARNFPRKWVVPFAVDWTRRYWWVAGTKSWRHRAAAARGIAEGLLMSLKPGKRRPIGLASFERFAMAVQFRRSMATAAREHGIESVLIADVGKNLLPIFEAALACGVRVVAVADDRLARPGRRYRGVPVVTDDAGGRMIFDAVLVGTVAPVRAAERVDFWRSRQSRPVIDLTRERTTATRRAA